MLDGGAVIINYCLCMWQGGMASGISGIRTSRSVDVWRRKVQWSLQGSGAEVKSRRDESGKVPPYKMGP